MPARGRRGAEALVHVTASASPSRRAAATASPSTTRSRSRGARPSSRSRTAPPTTHTPARRPARRPAAAPGRARRRSGASGGTIRAIIGAHPAPSRAPRHAGGSSPARMLGAGARCWQAVPGVRAGQQAGRRLQPGRRVHDRGGADTSAPERERPQAVDTSLWPTTATRRDRRDYVHRPDFAEPAVQARLVVNRRDPCSSSRRRSTERSLFLPQGQRGASRDPEASGRILWRRTSAGSRPPRRRSPTDASTAGPQSAERGRRPAASPRSRRGRQRCGRAAAEPRGVLAAARPRPRLLRHRERHGLRAARQATAAHDLDATRPPAPSRAARRSRTARSTSATTAAKVHAVRASETASGCGRSARAARASARLRPASTRRPAVAFGRVYLGNTDGRVYSFSAGPASSRGRPDGGYVYSSPRRAQAGRRADGLRRLLRRHVLRVRRAHRAGALALWPSARISGAATLLGGIVYFSDLGTAQHHRAGRTHRQRSSRSPPGAFNPVVADRARPLPRRATPRSLVAAQAEAAR